MQAVMETAFDILYLCTVCILGFTMIRKAKGSRMLLLFGIMAVTLGLGDAFHLVPRAYALCTDGLAAHTTALGIGKFITSITMTIFYLLLFHIWELRYNRHSPLLRTGKMCIRDSYTAVLQGNPHAGNLSWTAGHCGGVRFKNRLCERNSAWKV